MKYIPSDRLAKAAGCHVSSVYRLIKSGKLTGSKDGRRFVVEAESIDAAVRTVQANLQKHGYHQPNRGKKNGELTEAQMFEEPTIVTIRKADQPDPKLGELFRWLRIDAGKRQALIAMAERFTVDELKLLLTMQGER